MTERQPSLFGEPEGAPWEVDDRHERLVATVVFPEWEGEFDYEVPDRLRGQIESGRRIRVPLGKSNRPVVGYCVGLDVKPPPSAFRRKEVLAALDEGTLLAPAMLRLTRWLADYYVCTWGQAIESAVPAGVRLAKGTRETVLLAVRGGAMSEPGEVRLSPVQRTVLRVLCESNESMTAAQLAAAAGCSLGPIQQLRKKGLIEATTRRVLTRPAEPRVVEGQDPFTLNHEQRGALEAIVGAVHRGASTTFLMHGVTGSGKTEVYIRAIDEVLQFGRQAIVLVPEISLTPQAEHRFRSRFPRVAVLHSHMSDAERHAHWLAIARGSIQVVVGARSAVFAPLPRLGLIVIDEEHDASFKQDSTPRYHARRVALERCRLERAALVLGSATPSLESYHAAMEGRYVRMPLDHRVHRRPLPRVDIVDLRIEHDRRTPQGCISRPLYQAMSQALRADGQVILLLNRRGFSTSIQCPACGHVVKCAHCDIGLTHHRADETAVCHYCDYRILAPPRCPKCGFDGIRYRGLGTQRLEAEVRSRFRDAPCLRMDSDTMRKPGAHEKALEQFRSGDVRILLGTQMIAKGLDFPDVTLVGVINADTALHFPNFRASERTFQLVTQVAGRTGRGARAGRVLVQTYSPDHPAIVTAAQHDYVRFANLELPARARFHYPPHGEMVRVVLRGEDASITDAFARDLTGELRSRVDSETRIVGPAPTPIAKLHGRYRFHLLLIAANHEPIRAAVRDAARSVRVPDGVQWIADVDPLDML
ncbi:MAG: primosomal protein N' [Planctomycetes bacterium]|nr:primosomal protein N' [Planctomycetota bacterium]